MGPWSCSNDHLREAGCTSATRYRAPFHDRSVTNFSPLFDCPCSAAVSLNLGHAIILSIVGWTGLARVVRGKLLQLRAEDYVIAAKIAGMRETGIIAKHLLPGFMSYLIVHLTLAIPGMILGETALSFIGVGLQPPALSWGVLLQQAQNVRTVALSPWLLAPGVLVVITVLCFNFVGDGLRDAADPYKQ